MEDDKYTTMLKEIKTLQLEQAPEVTEADTKITFEDYEAFMKRLESENRLDKLELYNPRSAVYKELLDAENKRRMSEIKF